MYIAIAGNIGCGKTTLTEMLEKRYGAKAYYEEPNNPYIGDFYKDMERWAFNLQAYFLAARIEQVHQIAVEGAEMVKQGKIHHILQDRTIHEDAHIFARNLAGMGHMSKRDFEAYMKMYHLFSSFVPQPDLLIYLRASVPKLKEQILQRGREYELQIEEEYLELLDQRYTEWTDSYEGEMLVVDVDTANIKENPESFAKVCECIDALSAKLGR
ncbi:MAG: deoxynucleoside kinase [Rikenellaceae bacterium]